MCIKKKKKKIVYYCIKDSYYEKNMSMKFLNL